MTLAHEGMLSVKPDCSIRVLVVDDSAFMRKAISRMLDSAEDIEVVGVASSGQEALELLPALQPDVITLDVVMPDLDGLEVLRRIMATRPTPVLMLSSLTSDGGAESLEALATGAVDVLEKPSELAHMNMYRITEALHRKVRTAAGVDTQRLSRSAAHRRDETPTGDLSRTEDGVSAITSDASADVVVIGCSTGGPPALQRLLSALPPLPCAIVVVQHMPPGFTQALAERLDRICSMPVKHASYGDLVAPGRVLVAPSGWQFHFDRKATACIARIDKRPAGLAHAPSVDVTMSSAAAVFGSRSMGVLMTGMGADGAHGMKAIHEARGFTIAEAESSALIWGMPRSAIELGAASEVHDLDDIADCIVRGVFDVGGAS